MSIGKLINISPVGENKGAPRIWFEANRLKALGFEPHSRMALTDIQGGIRLSSAAGGERKVSSKRGIPVIDLNSHKALSQFGIGETIKVTSSFGRIDILPTQRSFQKLATFLQEGAPVETTGSLTGNTPIQNELSLFA